MRTRVLKAREMDPFGDGGPADDAGLCAAESGLVRLRLSNFRNHAASALDCDLRSVVLTGANGAGKTNLLEALSFLAPGRGLRSARLSDVGRRAATEETARPWAVSATIKSAEDEIRIGVGLESGGEEGDGERRTVRIDGVGGYGPKTLGERVRIAWLTPQMDRLFAEGASGRRRFLDRMTLGFDPEHAQRAASYERSMRERMRLLETGSRDDLWLSAIESRMAEEGVAIAASRRETAARLNRALGEAESAFPRASLAIEGALEGWLEDLAATEAEDKFRSALAEGRREDAGAGRTLVGPHRSDLVVWRARTGELAARSSTGEQKALLIGIVLANARLLALESGAVPLLLLDEVAAHLDRERREALFDSIAALGAQAWLTGTDRSLFSGFGERAQYFSVSSGRVTPDVR